MSGATRRGGRRCCPAWPTARCARHSWTRGRADPEARCSAEALLVEMRGAARGDEYTACPPRRRIERGVDGGLRFV